MLDSTTKENGKQEGAHLVVSAYPWFLSFAWHSIAGLELHDACLKGLPCETILPPAWREVTSWALRSA